MSRTSTGVGQFRFQFHLGSGDGQVGTVLQLVVDGHIQRGGEGVQIGVHEAFKVKRWVSSADLGRLLRVNGGSLLSSDH